jgi:hypothetical protein
MNRWPRLASQQLRLRSEPNRESARRGAAAMRREVEVFEADFRAFGMRLFDDACAKGYITEASDPASPVGVKYSFRDFNFCQFYTDYFTFRIVLNRMLNELGSLCGEPDDANPIEYQALCRQIWMIIPYLRKLGIASGVNVLASFFLTVEGATTEAERGYLTEFISEFEGSHQIITENKVLLEGMLLAEGSLATERVLTRWTGINGMEDQERPRLQAERDQLLYSEAKGRRHDSEVERHGSGPLVRS